MLDNDMGFTLAEFLVAIFILMVGLLGLLQSINVAMDKNLDNILRNEAVQLADDRMMLKRSKSFTQLSTTVANPTKISVALATRGILKNYSVQEKVISRTNLSKEVVIDVSWKNKNVVSSHSISSIVSTFQE
jgi:type IV pilus assembly protein PilV